jgi:hypothetical protein
VLKIHIGPVVRRVAAVVGVGALAAMAGGAAMSAASASASGCPTGGCSYPNGQNLGVNVTIGETAILAVGSGSSPTVSLGGSPGSAQTADFDWAVMTNDPGGYIGTAQATSNNFAVTGTPADTFTASAFATTSNVGGVTGALTTTPWDEGEANGPSGTCDVPSGQSVETGTTGLTNNGSCDPSITSGWDTYLDAVHGTIPNVAPGTYTDAVMFTLIPN